MNPYSDTPCVRPIRKLTRKLTRNLIRKQSFFCVLAVAVSALPLLAQNGVYSPRFGMGHRPDVTIVKSSNVGPPAVVAEENCFPWRISETRGTTVSAARLKVPPQALREYKGACDAYANNKFDEAELHARGAIGKFQNYSAAWVLLGLSLEGEQKAQEARDACSHAASTDATYLPAYLCGAEVSSQNQAWQEVITSADQALGVQTDGVSYPYYYRAKAYLHLNNLSEAKKSALRAIEIDVDHSDPSLYFVLAQIYQREGNTADAIAQLQQLLNHNPDALQAEMAKQLLAKLQSQQSAK
jgi:tetratricopeptide (TPR) repeat protein